MKKHLPFLLLLSALVLLSCAPSNISSDSSSSLSSSSSNPIVIDSSDWSSYEETSEEVFEGEIGSEVVLDGSDAVALEGGLSFSIGGGLGINSSLSSAEGGKIFLLDGAFMSNEEAYSSFTGIEVDFSSSDETSFLLAKGSYFSIDNGAIGAKPLASGTRLDFEDGCRYFSLYAAVGSFEIDAIRLYSEKDMDSQAREIDAIDIYTINDTHGGMTYNGEDGQYQLGISKLSAVYEDAYSKNVDGTVILSSGDMWQGSAISNLTYGEAMIRWMNLVGFDAMAVGNHEFDWGSERIASNSEIAHFPFLGINVRDDDGEMPPFMSPSKVVTRGGVRIGIVGGIGRLEGSILASSLGGYYFADYSSLIDFEAKRLRYEEGCDIVVASLHNGDLDTRYCHDIDAVFLGHDHVSDYFVDNYGIPHVKCWANGSDIRSVRFVRDENGNWVFDGKERDYGFAEGSELADETKAAALLSYYEGEFETVLNEEVGYAEETISTRELVSIATESLYRFYKRDSWYPEIAMSIVNTGCARQDIVAGTITYGDVYASFPFDNDHIFAYVDGSDMSYVSRNNATYYEDSNWVKGEKYLVVVISYVYEKATYIYEEVGRDSVNRLRDVVSSYFLGEL